MCGIIGIVSNKKNAAQILLCGLKSLEYRGYDSAGIALNIDDKIKTLKSAGNISNLEKKIEKELNFISNIGIGHTRWATHGKPNEVNAHPHRVGNVILVHNGIIENHEKIKKDLINLRYKMASDTDTEIACALIDKIYQEQKDKLKALKKVSEIIKGSYAFGIIFDDEKNKIYAMRKDSPLIIAKGKDENYIASDVPAILDFTKEYILLEEKEIAVIDQNNIKIYNENLIEIKNKIHIYEGKSEAAKKNNYKHFMLKEINDEKEALANTYKQFIKNNSLNELIENMPDFSKYNKITIIACGSAAYAGLVGKSLIEKYANIPVNVEIASEYRYQKTFNDNKTLTILISQSGETADTLAALRKAKKEKSDTLGIINTVGSSIARESDNVLYIKVGCEIAVATTKAYMAQVLILCLIALNISYAKLKNKKLIIDKLHEIPNEVQKVIDRKREYDKIAKKIYKHNNIFFIGRGIDYSLCMEGSLKLKEISYIHSEAYPAGELKHGTISLIEKNTPVIAIVTDENIAEKTISNIKETKARGSQVLLVITEKLFTKYGDSDFYDYKIVIPNTYEIFQPLLVAPVLQLLAYEIASLRGEDIDKPRNLAKSVTVE